MTTNVAALLIEQTADVEAKAVEEPMTIIIGGIRVDEGAMDFADFFTATSFRNPHCKHGWHHFDHCHQ